MNSSNILKRTKTKLGNKIELISGSPAAKPFDSSPALIIGVFHGDEPQVKYLVEKYLNETLYPPLAKGSLLFIPCLNPDGMQLGTRTNANGVDLNRNFPTENWGEDGSAAGSDKDNYFGGSAPASEIETRFVIDVIEEYKPKVILTLHAPYKVVNYDGPAEEIALKISNIINYPVETDIGYPTPGSFGTYAGLERNVPTITLELDEKIPVAELIQPVFDIFTYLGTDYR